MKYKDLHATVPSEISTQLAQVTLALGSAEDQVHSYPLFRFCGTSVWLQISRESNSSTLNTSESDS